MEQQMGGFEDIKVASANQMQMELAKMHGEDLGEFIATKARDFRNIVNAHPEYLEEYKNAPEATLRKIEPLLYH